MGEVVYLKRKFSLKVVYKEKIISKKETIFTDLVEVYSAAENNGWIYYIELAKCELSYWRINEYGTLVREVIELINLDYEGALASYVSKIYLDNEVIFDIDNYQIKNCLYYDDLNDEYINGTYLYSKKEVDIPQYSPWKFDEIDVKQFFCDREALLDKAITIANSYYNGYFNLLKYDGLWRCGFGEIIYIKEFLKLSSGKSVEEAIIRAIDNFNNSKTE